MKSFIAIAALVAIAAADVSHILNQEADAQVLKQESDVHPGGYQYNYETSNGIRAQESGSLKNVGSENEAIEVQGSNAYTAPDGQPIQITYVADENGYRPQGAHLPTTPAPQPIPEYIQRALAYILANPPKSEVGRNY